MRDLNLMDCDLGDQGALALADALHDNSAILAPTLRALNLCANDLGDVSVLKVCQALGAVFPREDCARMNVSDREPRQVCSWDRCSAPWIRISQGRYLKGVQAFK